MRTIIQKGIAGMGNRFQVLARCCDFARQVGAQVVADWRDTSFRGKFSDVFDCATIQDFEPGEYQGIEPVWWGESDRINAPCAKVLAGENFARPTFKDGPWKTFVVCLYVSKYDDSIFDQCKPNNEVYRYAAAKMEGIEQYKCWHVRNTDKAGPDTQRIIADIINASEDGKKKVVLTDSEHVKSSMIQHGIYCPSDVPHQPVRGGIHHANDSWLSRSGLSKKQLNISCVADIVIGTRADEFTDTCGNSSYADLINKARKHGGWYRGR